MPISLGSVPKSWSGYAYRCDSRHEGQPQPLAYRTLDTEEAGAMYLCRACLRRLAAEILVHLDMEPDNTDTTEDKEGAADD